MQRENDNRILVSIILIITEFSPDILKNSIQSVMNQKNLWRGKFLDQQPQPLEDQKEFFTGELILLDLTEDTACLEWLEDSYPDEEDFILLKASEQITRGQGINWGAKTASGEYLAFMESGTQWAAEKLEKQASYLEKSQQAGWVYGIVAIRGKEKAYRPNPGLPPYKKAGSLFYDLLRESTISLDTVMVKRDIFLELGGVDEELPALVDEEFLLRLSRHHLAAYMEQVMAVILPREEGKEASLAVRMLLCSTYAEELRQSCLTEEVVERLWQEAGKQKQESLFWEYAEILKEDELFAPVLEKIWQEKHPSRKLILSQEPTVAGVTNCVGCCGCESACPVDAIVMKPNQEGFLYPRVDEETCILCGKCLKVCPTQQEISSFPRPEKCYALQADETAQRDSSSGGIFPLLAEAVLARGGYVAGAVYGKDHRVEHIISNKPEDIFRMRSSKYVQSDTRGVFAEIKRLLEEEQEVFFTGCACQVAGLKAYLGKAYPKLYTADVVCHGVPSPRIYESYLKEHEQMAGPVQEINFRKKQVLGWKSGVYIRFQRGKTYTAKGYDPYMAVFLNDWGLRESCYQCEFKGMSYSDITLGDFWGIEQLEAGMEKGQGTSVVTVNTAKGVQLFGDIRSRLNALRIFPTERAVTFNPSMAKPVRRKLTLDNDTFENTGKSRFFERRTSRVLY